MHQPCLLVWWIKVNQMTTTFVMILTDWLDYGSRVVVVPVLAHGYFCIAHTRPLLPLLLLPRLSVFTTIAVIDRVPKPPSQVTLLISWQLYSSTQYKPSRNKKTGGDKYEYELPLKTVRILFPTKTLAGRPKFAPQLGPLPADPMEYTVPSSQVSPRLYFVRDAR